MSEVKHNAVSSTVRIADQTVTRGNGGEVHQPAGGDVPVLTTQQGIPVSDDQNSLRIGQRGPLALEDFHFREKVMHFDHERIPERVVHARGFGAHGFFENYACSPPLLRQTSFRESGKARPHSSGSRPSPVIIGFGS
jgi:catalase